MKLAAFNALPLYTLTSEVQAAPVGTYYLWMGESAQQGNTDLRHRITYHQRVAVDSNSLAGQDSINNRRVFDLLESDDLGQSTKTAAKPKINESPARDDNNRNFIKEGDWS